MSGSGAVSSTFIGSGFSSRSLVIVVVSCGLVAVVVVVVVVVAAGAATDVVSTDGAVVDATSGPESVFSVWLSTNSKPA